MVRVLSSLGLGLACLLASAAGYAQVYTCTDQQGKLIISDRLLKECANRPVTELDKRGIPVRDIAAPMSDAERQQQERRDKARQQALARQEDRQRQDQALMARYKSEKDIEAARKKDTAQIDQRIADSDAALRVAQQQLAQARQEATTPSQQGTPADVVQKRIQDAQFLIDKQQNLVAANRREKDQMNARYDQILQTFRALSANQPAPTGNAQP